MQALVAMPAPRAPSSESSVMETVQLDFHVTPFRAERFYEAFRVAVPRVLAYGARGYMFYRLEEDPDHFVHLSWWEDRSGFERFWFSGEMRAIREQLFGLYDQPLLPYWGTLIDQG